MTTFIFDQEQIVKTSKIMNKTSWTNLIQPLPRVNCSNLNKFKPRFKICLEKLKTRRIFGGFDDTSTSQVDLPGLRIDSLLISTLIVPSQGEVTNIICGYTQVCKKVASSITIVCWKLNIYINFSHIDNSSYTLTPWIHFCSSPLCRFKKLHHPPQL